MLKEVVVCLWPAAKYNEKSKKKCHDMAIIKWIIGLHVNINLIILGGERKHFSCRTCNLNVVTSIFGHIIWYHY